MQLVSITNKPKHLVLSFLLVSSLCATAQQNSPFSRFGLGDVLPASNVLNRAMGGISAAHSDGASINFNNPASYSRLNLVTFDVGVTIDSRNLKSANPVASYNSVNFTPSYVFLGLPIGTPAQKLRNRNFSLVLGLRPVSSINYSIIEGSNVLPNNTDSVVYLYEGSGGLNQAVLGLSKRWGGFSVGINAGYTFGRKENNTRTFLVDTAVLPSFRSNSSTVTSFGGSFINGGMLYEGKVGKTSTIRLGASGNLSQTITGEQDVNRETFFFDGNGGTISIDTIYTKTGGSGKIELPSTFNVGIALANKFEKSGYVIENRMIGIDYTTSKWSDYRFFGQSDNLVNSWMLKVGGHIIPKPFDNNFWNNVSYRAGFQFGRDHVTAQGQEYKTYAFTIGAGIPIRNWRSYDRQTTQINTAFELGKRGSDSNNITENYFRFSVGLNLGDIWFIKRRYD